MISTIFISILMFLTATPFLIFTFYLIHIKEYPTAFASFLPAIFILAVGFKAIGI